MKRQPPSAAYGDSNMNPYVGSAQRIRMNNYAETDNHPYKSSSSSVAAAASKLESQWHWDRDSQTTLPNQIPPSSHSFNEGQGGNGARPYYQGQAPDPKLGLENQANKEARTQPHEQDMELGYEDNTLPLSFDALERKFFDEVMKLSKEQTDAEDAENARHREKIVEINTRYQEKLSALRAQQANQREEYLHKESQARLSQYQQAGLSHYPSSGLQDAHGYTGAAVGGVAGEAHRAYTTNQYESYRERSQFVGGGRTQGAEGRIPYPEGRVYNNARVRYF